VSWLARQTCPQHEHTRRRRRNRTSTMTPSAAKRTPMTDAPRRLSVRLNAVVARTSSSLKSR
jgi:hypothetical protein